MFITDVYLDFRLPNGWLYARWASGRSADVWADVRDARATLFLLISSGARAINQCNCAVGAAVANQVAVWRPAVTCVSVLLA